MTGLVLRRASVRPGTLVDVALVGGRIMPAPPAGGRAGWDDVDLDGRPLLPGLADHHLHLLATAAARASVDCSPAALADGGGLVEVLQRARARQVVGWLRGVEYDVARSGPLDRRVLDEAAVGPVRIQDRTGIRWTLDSSALQVVLPTDPDDWPAGVERDGAGRPNGVLVRLDAWLRARLPGVEAHDLGPLGGWLAERGVTAVTDAGAGNGPAELALLAAAGLPQRITAMTAAPETDVPDGIALGPVKILLDEADLPPFDDLQRRVAAAHLVGRVVAVHCVSDVALVLALAAGVGRRDRIEHASVVPDALMPVLVDADPTVVVQPSLVATKGDRYLRETPVDEHPGLHRLASLRAAGLRVAASSDAPYGDPDPWAGVAAAVERRTADGQRFTPGEAVEPLDALQLWLGPPDSPGERRAVTPGGVADLVVLDDGWRCLARRPTVLATLVDGDVVSGSLPT